MDISADTFASLRERMVREQIAARGIVDGRVLAAMQSVPRHEFVPQGLQEYAYHDRALPIGWEQTISQPYTVAFMCAALRLTGSETVLEVGAGSGYCAAVLSLLCQRVISVERISELAQSAQERLARLSFTNVTVQPAAAVLGWPVEGPYERIIVTAGADSLPRALTDQLTDGGQLLIPVTSDGPKKAQTMLRITREGNRLEREDLGEFVFVPLITGDESGS